MVSVVGHVGVVDGTLVCKPSTLVQDLAFQTAHRHGFLLVVFPLGIVARSVVVLGLLVENTVVDTAEASPAVVSLCGTSHSVARIVVVRV